MGGHIWERKGRGNIVHHLNMLGFLGASCPIGSAVLMFIGHKRTDRKKNKQTNTQRQAKNIYRYLLIICKYSNHTIIYFKLKYFVGLYFVGL